MADDLFSRIRRALSEPVDSSTVALVISSVRAAADDNRHWRTQHEAAIVDPLAEHEAVVSADAALAETHIRERRLAEAERQLVARLAEIRETEAEGERRIRYDRAKAMRDKAAIEIRDAWVKHAKGLAAVMERIAKVDAEVRSAYDRPPAGETGIDSVIHGLYVPGSAPNQSLPFTSMVNVPAVAAWGAPGITASRRAAWM